MRKIQRSFENSNLNVDSHKLNLISLRDPKHGTDWLIGASCFEKRFFCNNLPKIFYIKEMYTFLEINYDPTGYVEIYITISFCILSFPWILKFITTICCVNHIRSIQLFIQSSFENYTCHKTKPL